MPPTGACTAFLYWRPGLTRVTVGAQAIPGMVYAADTKTWRMTAGCGAVDTMPPLSFVMSNRTFTLGPRQYIIQACPHTHLVQTS